MPVSHSRAGPPSCRSVAPTPTPTPSAPSLSRLSSCSIQKDETWSLTSRSADSREEQWHRLRHHGAQEEVLVAGTGPPKREGPHLGGALVGQWDGKWAQLLLPPLSVRTESTSSS